VFGKEWMDGGWSICVKMAKNGRSSRKKLGKIMKKWVGFILLCNKMNPTEWMRMHKTGGSASAWDTIRRVLAQSSGNRRRENLVVKVREQKNHGHGAASFARMTLSQKLFGTNREFAFLFARRAQRSPHPAF
jgi:hypothetical protein